MNIAERSIKHHRGYFWFWVSLVLAALPVTAYLIYSTGQTNACLAMLGLIVVYFGIPAAASYRNWKFVVANQDALAGLDAADNLIVAKK